MRIATAAGRPAARPAPPAGNAPNAQPRALARAPGAPRAGRPSLPARDQTAGVAASSTILQPDAGRRAQEAEDGRQPSYDDADAILQRLLVTPELDEQLGAGGATQEDAEALLRTVEAAKATAYSSGSEGSDVSAADVAHLFLQRVLYRINRLVFFWFGDLDQYTNEASPFLAQLRASIEREWQAWEARAFQRRAARLYPSGVLPSAPEQVKQELRRLGSQDVDPPLSPALAYISDELSLDGYKHLLAIASLDGLVEASRQSRVCAGVGNSVSCAVFRVLMEEYGSGRLSRKHSTVFASMMAELGLDSRPEHYLALAPWQLLRAINHNFLLTERRRHYLRYLGGLTFFELSGPSLYRTYQAAARRLGLSEAAASYWELHVREDERHGAQMLAEVALPLADAFPGHAREVLQGYLQEKWVGEEAGAAIVAAIQAQPGLPVRAV